jgi:hypothetical protein
MEATSHQAFYPLLEKGIYRIWFVIYTPFRFLGNGKYREEAVRMGGEENTYLSEN